MVHGKRIGYEIIHFRRILFRVNLAAVLHLMIDKTLCSEWLISV